MYVKLMTLQGQSGTVYETRNETRTPECEIFTYLKVLNHTFH